MVAVMFGAPQANAAPTSKPLPAGGWLSKTGTYSYDVSGTGDYSGTVREEVPYTVKYEVLSSDKSTVVIRYSETDSWTCTATGEWTTVCDSPSGVDLYQTDYTIDVATLQVTATYDAPSTKSSTQKEVGHPTWILLGTDLSVGDTATQWWKVPNSDGQSSTITDVLWKVDEIQKITVKGMDVIVRSLTYTGDHIGSFWWETSGQEFHSRGLETESEYYDTIYGLCMGLTVTGTYTYSDSVGGWTEKYADTNQFADTNLDFRPPQVSITLGRPSVNVAVTVDNVSYAGDQLPKVFTWDPGSAHTLQVDKMVQGDAGVRYVFVQWSDGSKDASRSVTPTQSSNLTAAFKTQYELQVTSDLGNPQGSDWYDAESTATFSVTSPQPETGLFGLLGGKATFRDWTGDSTANTPTANIVMDAPKTVQAEWTTDDSQPYMILGGIGVAVLVAIILAFLLMRRKKAPALTYAPAPPPPPTAPPTAPTATGPAATKYCIDCGAQIPLRAKHCNKCGAPQA